MKKYYAILICFAGLLLHLCACGLVVTSFSVYLPLLRETVGLNNTQVSIINTIRCLSSMITMMFAAKYYRKLSLRQGTGLACILIPAGCLVFSIAKSALVCYLASSIMGFSYGVGTMIPIAILMKNWFLSNRATATAICTLGSSFSTIFAPPIISKLAEQGGVSYAFRMEAAFIAICAVVIFSIVRDTPEKIGLCAWQKEEKPGRQKKMREKPDQNLSRIEWILFMGAAFLVGAAGTPATANMAVHFVTAGYTQMQTAAAISLFGVILLFAKFSFGAGCDRFGTYRMNYLYLGCWVIADLYMAQVNGRSMAALMLSVILLGIGHTIGALGITCWTNDFSKSEMYDQCITRNQTLFSVGSLIMTPFPGILADVTGSYRLAYTLFGIMALLMMLAIQILYVRHRKKKSVSQPA